jgi:predicted Zn-dependent protease
MLQWFPTSYVPTLTEEDHAEALFFDLKDDYALDTTSGQHRELQGMFDELAIAAGFPADEWRVHLFDDPEMVDVRAIRGNYLFAWSGVFDIAESRDEIAGLLACEIAHTLANHNKPVEFNLATEVMFGVTDITASLGIMILSQGAISVSGTGMTRWLYVQAADLDDLDRVYNEQQVQEMADIAVNILARSDYAPAALLSFWKRAATDAALGKRVKRLSRRISPEERVAYFEVALQSLPTEPGRMAEPPPVEELARLSGR